MPSRKTTTPTDAKASRKFDELAREAAALEAQQQQSLIERGVKPGRIGTAPEEALGARISEAREAKGLTQGQLAELTKSLDPEDKGMSRAVISLYEAGKNRPGPKEMRLLCEALRITPNFLIYGDDHPFDALGDERRLGTRTRNDPEGFAWLAYVIATLHHNHYDAIMKLSLDLHRGWNASFDQGVQDAANTRLLEMAEALRARIQARKVKEG